MTGHEPVTRASIFYWIGMAILLIGVATIVWIVLRPPSQLGI